MVDFNIDNLMKRCINEVINNKNKIPKIEELWFSLTRQMFNKYPAVVVLTLVDNALVEASDSQWLEHKYPNFIFKEEVKVMKGKGKLREKIDANIRISSIAKQFGFEIDGRGKMLCPFHYDSQPSLFLNDSKNIFHCFGCGAKGDIIEFYRRLKEVVKNEEKRSS